MPSWVTIHILSADITSIRSLSLRRLIDVSASRSLSAALSDELNAAHRPGAWAGRALYDGSVGDKLRSASTSPRRAASVSAAITSRNVASVRGHAYPRLAQPVPLF
jgi:hypothetical protein